MVAVIVSRVIVCRVIVTRVIVCRVIMPAVIVAIVFVAVAVVVHVMLTAGFAAVVPLLSFANEVVLLVTLALIWWAVTLSTRVVIA